MLSTYADSHINISDLTALAVASALTDGLTETALAWLEQGHCFVWSQIKQLRTPVDNLRPLNPYSCWTVLARGA